MANFSMLIKMKIHVCDYYDIKRMNSNKHLSILQAMEHIKLNISPVAAQTFEQGLKDGRIIAHNLGNIELNEDIVDTTLFLRQITMAMYPNKLYPKEWYPGIP